MRGVCWDAVLLLNVTCYWYWCEGMCLEEERTALLHIKQSINFTYGSSLSHWVGQDCCQWDGVKCNSSTFRVIQIDLSSTREATLGLWYPNATLFSQFKELKALDLGNNHIGGWDMPQDFCKLSNLQELHLSDNNLIRLPHCLGNMSSLRWLYLDNNNLTESLSLEGLCGLTNLHDLDIGHNNLIQVPRCLWNMSSLSVLFLDHNNLTEAISLEGLCGLKNLEYLFLSYNRFGGRLPSCLGNLHFLNHLDLSFNLFNGSISSSIFTNLTSILFINLSNNKFDGHLSFSMFANNSQLEVINLSNNSVLVVDTEDLSWSASFQLSSLKMSNCNLNKHGGSEFPSFLSAQNNLRQIDLSSNGLLGEIPSWFFHNKSSLIAMWLGNNSLDGSFVLPFSPNTSNLVLLDISDNQIQGAVPTNIGLLLPNLLFLNMSNNVLQGSVPSSLGRITGLEVLDLSNNNFLGEIPNQLTLNMTSLRFLDLSRNALEGRMLPMNSVIPNLEFLYLNGNRFTGKISSLSNSSLLRIVDISNNYMSGSIRMMLPSELSALLLKGNFFRGHIPDQLCKMQNLHILDLSHNNLSGRIPSCFNNITSWKKISLIDIQYETILIQYIHVSDGFDSFPGVETLLVVDFMTKGNLYSYKGGVLSLMTGIDISTNRLTGNIPPELGHLKELHGLNLSHNSLTGSIPKSFQSLEQLESLDLSFNRLNGTIPSTLNQLHFMSHFNVSHNLLSGRIPDYKNQFATFDESSYEGNPGLCGEPLKNRCHIPSNGTEEVEEGKEDGEDDDDSPFLYYSFVALSYVLGFWASFGLLIFKKSWRKKYFKAIDGCFDYCVERLRRRRHERPQQNRRR